MTVGPSLEREGEAERGMPVWRSFTSSSLLLLLQSTPDTQERRTRVPHEVLGVCFLEPPGCSHDARVSGWNVHVPAEREAGDHGGAPADRSPEDLHRPRAGEAGWHQTVGCATRRRALIERSSVGICLTEVRPFVVFKGIWERGSKISHNRCWNYVHRWAVLEDEGVCRCWQEGMDLF